MRKQPKFASLALSYLRMPSEPAKAAVRPGQIMSLRRSGLIHSFGRFTLDIDALAVWPPCAALNGLVEYLVMMETS